MRTPRSNSFRRQRGAVLYIALVLLIVLTLLGLASIGGTVLQERMAGNYRVQQLAFQNAEARLRAAERAALASALASVAIVPSGFDPDLPTDPDSVEYWARRDPAAEQERFADICGPAGFCSLTSGTGGNTPIVDQVLQVSVASFDREADPTTAAVLQSIFVP